MLNRARAAGFTMIELITVMVLIGVLSALAASRFFERSSFEARAFSDRTLAMLRYGQKLAIAQNRPVYVRLDGGKSVALCFAAFPADGSCTVDNQVVPPALNNSGSTETLVHCANTTTWYCEGLPADFSYTSSLNIPDTSPVTYGYFYFDGQGKPFASGNISPTPVSSFTLFLIRITGDGNNHDIYIEPETGYVHS
jgi:MSHA pilin protein MshC